MKIEAGKFYKTRDGRKARIYCLDGGSLPIHGGVLYENGFCPCQWLEDGRFDTYESRADLVSEWTEPKPRMLAWMCTTSPNGAYCYFFPEDQTPKGTGWTRAPWLDEPKESK